ncbi:hypothetical protein LSCM4_05832 [Leishmania orientalis]|uniref:Uncharacterized protein n=1 Tax=Leishmania orientalis TaxID=2249476 RepID=A0A836KLC4_9TRYP|nr:hypothetical protein LSCM4_05832 [Leishmania orientalis]
MSRAGLAPRWMSGDATLTTSPTAPSRACVTAAPFARSPASSHGASSRGVDPYQVCRAHVDQLLKLQGEQVELAQTLRAVLRIASMHAEPIAEANTTDGAPQRASAAKSVIDNAENVFPVCRGYHSSTSARQQRPTSASTEAGTPPTPKSSSSPSLGPSVMSLVHRLYVLQRESVEFAATQCMPSVAELFATFEAYWTWKLSQMCVDGVWEDEEADTTPATGSLASTHSAIDGATTASRVSQPRPSQRQRPPTLRQRYDQALRVRDELLSLLQLNSEAVRSLDVQVEQWRQCRDSAPVSRYAPGWLTESPADIVGASGTVPRVTDMHVHAQRREFEAYICQLVEVTQATHHIAQLLKTALQALCRPSPRTMVPSVMPSATAVERIDLFSGASKELPQSGGNAAHSAAVHEGRLGRLQTRHSVNTEGLAASGTSAQCDRAYSSTELSAITSSSPAFRTGGAATRPGCSLRSSRHLNDRTPRQVAKPTQCGDARFVKGANNDTHSSWMDALSPLTPPPDAATASVSPPTPSPHCVECSEPHSQQLQRQRRNQRSLSPSLSPPGAAAQTEGSASLAAASRASSRCASPSSAGAVSLSPLTVQCGAATTAAAVVPAQSREERIGRDHQRPDPMHSFASQLWRSGKSEVSSGIEAAVTPVVAVRLAEDGAAPHDCDDDKASRLSADAEHPSWLRGNCLSRDGARSLLRELTSASADAVAVEGSRVCKSPQSAGSCGRDVREGPAAVDSALRIFGEAAAVYVPPFSEQPLCHSGDAPSLSTAPEFADVTRGEEGRTTSQPSPSPSLPPHQTSEAHTAAAPAATRPSVSAGGSTSLQYLSPRSPSMVGAAGRSPACDEYGGAGEQGCLSVGRAASIPTCLWPQLHDRAASPSSSSAVPVLASADVEDAQPAQSTTESVPVPHRPSSKEEEGSRGTTITHSASHTADVNFYTARDSDTDVSPPPALTAALRASASTAPSESMSRLLQRTQHPKQQQGHQQPHVKEWDRSVSSTPLLLDNLESELVHVQQRLQELAPPRHSSPALSASIAAADNSAAAEALRRSLENRVRLTMHEGLKALRAEQRHSLRKVRKYVKHTLEEVAEAVSAVSSRNQSSRGSSCLSSRSRPSTTAHEGNDNGADSLGGDARPTRTAEQQLRAARASQQVQTEVLAASTEMASAPASNAPRSSAAHPSPLLNTEQQHTAPAAPASPKAQELQRSLAVAEAKAARLEQLTVQLKKRLWMAELAQLSPASETRLPQKLTGAAKRRFSLRDAFVYGLSSEVSDTEVDDGGWSEARHAAASEGCCEGGRTAADGVAVEERAMLYLVDRELGCRTAWDARAQSQQRSSALLHTVGEMSRSSRQVSCDDSGPSASTERECSLDMRCFEDDTAAAFLPPIISAPAGVTGGLPSRRLDWSSAVPVSATSITNAMRSPGIRRQRASIFQVLRQSRAAWDAQSSAPSGQRQQRQSGSCHPSPSPSRQHCRAGTMAEGPAVLTPRAQSVEQSSPRLQTQRLGQHPYNAAVAPHGDQRNAKERATVGDLRPSVCSHYYTAISEDGGGGSVAGARPRSPTSASALRAEQVLQNAKRLLQSRSASLAAGHHDIRNPWPSSAPLAGGLSSSFSAVSSAKRCADSREHCLETRHRHGGGTTGGASASPGGYLSEPRQWGDRVEQLDGASPPPRAFADADPHSGTTDAALGLQRVSDSQDRRKGGSFATDGAHGSHSRSRSRSPGSDYRDYDTSPCSAVAYSTGKLPRASSPPGAKAAPSSMGQRSTPPSVVAGPPLLADMSRAATSATTARHARRRVDSATSPAPRKDAEVLAAADRGERSASSHSDVAAHHPERSARAITGCTECGCSPPSICTTGSRSTRGHRSPSSLLHPTAEHRVHDSKRVAPMPLTSRLSRSTSQCPSCSKSSASSCGSAQQQLLGTLEEQESTLAAALDQLQMQRRQLREKHQQVSLLMKRKTLVDAVHALPRTMHDGGQRAAGGATANAGKPSTRARDGDRDGSAAAGETSHSSTYLHHLLKRLKAAESSLADREQRVREALRVVQRQRSALLRDDLL